MASKVIVAGLNVVDFICGLPEQFEHGKKHQVDNIIIQGGAPAGNAACGMASLGLDTAFLGYVGENAPSDIALRELQEHGVDTSLMLHSAKAQPASAMVLVEPRSGERTVFYSTTAYRALSADDIQSQWLDDCSLVFVDGYDIEGNIELLKQAKLRKIPSVIDIEAGDPELLNTMLGLSAHAILPLEAAQALSGEQDPLACLNQLASRCEAQLVITDGENGSWALEQQQLVHQSAFKVEVVDTTGCGDAFHAAYAYSLLQNTSLSERMAFASAFAAIVAQHLGGRSYFPSASEVSSFIQQQTTING